MGELVAWFTSEIEPRIKSGLDVLAQDLAEQMRELAPQSSDQAVKSDRGTPVGPRPASEFHLGSDEKDQALKFNSLTRSQLARALLKAGPAASTKYARYFKYTKGPNRGQSPDRLLVSGRSLRGSTNRKGGALKRGIHAVPAEPTPGGITVKVRSEAVYSRPVEFGFTHRGGRHHKGAATKIEGKSFMRGPFKQFQVDGLGRLVAKIRG